MNNLIFCLLALCYAACVPLAADAQKTGKAEPEENQIKQELPISGFGLKPPDSKQKDSKKQSKAIASDNKVLASLREIFQALEKYYPSLTNELAENSQKRDKLIKAFAQSLNAGLKIESKVKADKKSGKEKSDGTEEKKRKNCFNIVNIASNKLSYIRIDRFEKGVFEDLQSDCAMVSNIAKQPVGIIIDLRNCSGSDDKTALDSARLFCKSKSIPLAPGGQQIKRAFALPVAMLVAAQTEGAAEIFVYCLAKARQAIAIGKPTAGKPFKMEEIELKSIDKMLLVPIVPKYLSDFVARPIKPSITTKAYPQISYKEISSKIGAEKNDKCLLRAVDLLISLGAIKHHLAR